MLPVYYIFKVNNLFINLYNECIELEKHVWSVIYYENMGHLSECSFIFTLKLVEKTTLNDLIFIRVLVS